VQTVTRPAVRIICVDAGGRVLMLQWRDPLSSALLWEPPGGGIEPGETPFDTARRELAEETAGGHRRVLCGVPRRRVEGHRFVGDGLPRALPGWTPPPHDRQLTRASGEPAGHAWRCPVGPPSMVPAALDAVIDSTPLARPLTPGPHHRADPKVAPIAGLSS
jgi:hypothetical protein